MFKYNLTTQKNNLNLSEEKSSFTTSQNKIFDLSETNLPSLISNLPIHKGVGIFLYGEMGSGKTTLVQKILQNLNIKDNAGSPTFNIIHQYDHTFKILHCDLYRVENTSQIMNELLSEMDHALILVEWANKSANYVPLWLKRVEITIENISNTRRYVCKYSDMLQNKSNK